MPKKPELLLDVQRPHLLVADFDRALRVYRDILGFTLNFLVDALPRVPWEMFGLPAHAKCRVAFLSEGRGAFGSIAMTEVTGIDLPRPQPPYRCTIIIEVKEGTLFPIIEKLKAESLEVGPLLRLEGPPRTDVSFSDHDGNRILLFEIYPTVKKPRSERTGKSAYDSPSSEPPVTPP